MVSMNLLEALARPDVEDRDAEERGRKQNEEKIAHIQTRTMAM